MSVKPRTYGIIAIGAVIVLGLSYVTFRPEPVLVDMHRVDSGPMTVTINADAVTRITDIYEVASPINGTALRAPVHVGDAVEGGQTVVAVVEPLAAALLDSRSMAQAQASVQEAEAAQRLAQAELTRALTEKAVAQAQYTRKETLVERDVASATELEDAGQRLALAKAGVETAAARMEMASGTLLRAQAALRPTDELAAENETCCVELRAPTDGTVLEVVHESEHPVTIGAPLVSIGDPTRLELVADLLSSDAVRLSPGAQATLDRWGGDALLTAQLDRIAPSARTKVSALGIEEQRVDAVFQITSPLSDRPTLGDGFSVFVRITEWQTDDTLMVPLSALFKRGDSWRVFVVEGDTALERQIEIGQRNAQVAQILSGLETGEQVILHPNDAITDGTFIALRPTP